MAFTVKQIAEVADGDAAEIAWEVGQGIRSTYTRVFQVITDSLVEDLNLLARDLPGDTLPGPDTIPRIGWRHPSDDGAAVLRIVPTRGEGRIQYFVTVFYDNPPSGGFSYDPADNPWEFSTATITESQVAEYDFGGHGSAGGDGNRDVENIDGQTSENLPPLVGSAGVRSIQNSARDVFVPPLDENIYLRQYNLRRYVSEWNEQLARQRVGKLNSTDFTFLGFNFPKYSLLCTAYETTGREVRQGGAFFQLNVTLIYKPYYTVYSTNVSETDQTLRYVPGWLRAVVDQGFNQLVGGEKQGITGETDGSLATDPRLLDGAGAARGDDAQNPYFLQFRTKGQDDMSKWGLPIAVP